MTFAYAETADLHGASEIVKTKDGSTLGVFYMRPVLNEPQSQIEGRPIFEATPYCKIRGSGDRKTIIDRPARAVDRERFPNAWRAFEAGQSGPVEGTPIEMMPLLSQTQIATLKHIGIATVEQLGEIGNDQLPKLGPGGDVLRDRAKAWLKGDAAETKMLRSQVLSMGKQIEQLSAKLDAREQHANRPTEGKVLVEAAA